MKKENKIIHRPGKSPNWIREDHSNEVLDAVEIEEKGLWQTVKDGFPKEENKDLPGPEILSEVADMMPEPGETIITGSKEFVEKVEEELKSLSAKKPKLSSNIESWLYGFMAGSRGEFYSPNHLAMAYNKKYGARKSGRNIRRICKNLEKRGYISTNEDLKFGIN